MLKCHSGCLHRRLVEDYHLARESQLDRAEAHSRGYVAEMREFFETVEEQILFKAWLIGSDSRRVAEAIHRG